MGRLFVQAGRRIMARVDASRRRTLRFERGRLTWVLPSACATASVLTARVAAILISSSERVAARWLWRGEW
ncbi:MAG TPA: hypothetical protein VMY88_12825 [Acidimicrobiales bacterium]|nr:hypothetical protein [Acidimicrobiales bacterium]